MVNFKRCYFKVCCDCCCVYDFLCCLLMFICVECGEVKFMYCVCVFCGSYCGCEVIEGKDFF